MSSALPVEIVNSILEFISENTSDLKRCSLVSPTWHAAAARILFSELHLLCSAAHPSSTAPYPRFKRHFDLAYGVIPVYKKQWLLQNPQTHCMCRNHQDRTIQSFCLNGASSSVHITRNVTRLKLIFCSSSKAPGSFSSGPHSLQLYPDSIISSLSRLIDQLSFVHLRFLIIESAPQVLYFMTHEPFSGVLSSAASSLEEINFTSYESMQNSDIKRLLNKHTFSCTRFPRLRRLLFQGLFRTDTVGPYGPRMSCALELLRRDSTTSHAANPPSVSVRVSYSTYRNQDALTDPSGFSRFNVPGWCCFSGFCTTLQEQKLFVDIMSLGTGVKDWSLPTVGIVLGAFQSDTLGQLADTLDIKVSCDVNDPSGTKLFAYVLEAYPLISSLNLCFGSIVDMRLALLHRSKLGPDRSSGPRTTQLLSLSKLSSLIVTLYDNAGLMIAFALSQVRNESQNQDFTVTQTPQQSQELLDVVYALDALMTELALTSVKQRDAVESSNVFLREVVVVVDIGGLDETKERMLYPELIEQGLTTMFSRTRAVSPKFLTVRVL